MKYISILIILLANQVFAQSEKQQDLETSIKNVTVFMQGAQITREGKSALKQGRSTIIVKSLSPHVEAKSIQVKGEGEFTILSVNHAYNYLDEMANNQKVDSLINVTKDLENNIANCNARIAVLMEKQSLLNENKKLGGENLSTSIAELKLAVDFYDKTLMEIKSEELKLKKSIYEQNDQLQKIRNQINDFQRYEGEPTSEIKIYVDVESNTPASFGITYIVANAGWFPKYDLRVKDIESPLELNYKAEVYQNTGVDWKNVKLKFSNGNPNQSGVAPQLNIWYLNYQRNTIYQNANMSHYEPGTIRSVHGRIVSEDGAALPGVNVVIKGSSIGTVTNVEGFYSLTLTNNASTLSFSSVGFMSEDIAITNEQINVNMEPDVVQLDEIVVVAYGSERNGVASSRPNNYQKPKAAKSIVTTKIENQTTVEFEVEIPYSLKSLGENLTVSLNSYDIETMYEYYAVPKLDKDAFLIARIINWDQFDLLEGEANLYFEDAYVGRSVLNAKSLTDTLDISLGRDKNIVIGREKIDAFTKRSSMGSNKVETRGFNIVARNKKSQPIHLTIFDQIPVSAISPIEVSTKELSGGILDSGSGEITWKLDIDPQSQLDLKLQYEVKYPKRESITLE